MCASRFLNLLPLLAGTLAVAVFCAMHDGGESPPARAKWSPPVRVERQSLRNLATELAALPPAERGAALDRMLTRGAHSITAEDAEWFLELQRQAAAEGWEVTTAQWHQFLEHWATAHPQDAAEFLEKRGLLVFPLRDARPVLMAWARGDAASIFAWVQAGGDARQSWWNQSRHTFAHAWLEHDKAAAWAWVNAGGSDGMECTILASVFHSASPETIASWLMLHSAPDAKISASARSTAISKLASLHLQNGGTETAMRWADSLFRSDELVAASSAILPSLTASAPDQAVAWLNRMAARQVTQPWQAKEAMSKWAATNAVAAGEWLNTHRNSSAAPAFIEAYAMSIAGDDPAAARQWIAQLPETPVQQSNDFGWVMNRADSPDRRALENLVRRAEISTLSLEDPVQAIKLASALPTDAGLMNYRLTLVREVPGEPPVPRFTPISPFG
jgi:hypothetical protein